MRKESLYDSTAASILPHDPASGPQAVCATTSHPGRGQAMKIAPRYLWGKTRHGYGYTRYGGCGLSIEKHGQTGHYGIYERNGTLLATCADYRSAQRIVARIRRSELAWFEEKSYQDFLLLEETQEGLTL